MKTLIGTLLQPQSNGDCIITKDSQVRFDESGRFTAVERAAGAGAGDVIGGDGCWIVPGFVDAHLHLPQWDRRGIDGLSVFEWQQKVGFPAELRLTDTHIAQTLAEDFATGVIASGTTTVAAFGSAFAREVDASFEVFARRGLRVTYGMTLSDGGVPDALCSDADKALEQSRELAAKWHGKEGGRLRYAFSPRSTLHCSSKLLRGAAALSELMNCPLQTHVADSSEEVSEVQKRFPDEIDELEIFEELGLLGPRTILAHGAFLDQHQRQDLAKSGTSLVHCPTANLFRASGLTDCMALRGAGIQLALGSSIGGGFDPFMPHVAVEALQTAKAISVHSVPRRAGAVLSAGVAWWVLTGGGAAALGLGNQTGVISPGYHADCLVIRPEKWVSQLPAEQQASAVLYTLTPKQIEHVFVGGKALKR